MMTIQNFWTMTTDQQTEVKATVKEVPVYNWIVQGQLNIQMPNFTGYGFSVNQTVRAADEDEAAQKVAQGFAGCYPGHIKIDWLNEGPLVFRGTI